MKRLDMNLNWTVERDGTGVRHPVSLPHDCMIYEKREKDSQAGAACGYFLPGKYLYRKNFSADPAWKDQLVILECEAVYKNATVLLNGKELNTHAYGYTGFYTEISEALDFESENKLTIIADNSKAPNSRWYSGSGIIRPVWLHIGPKCGILPDGIRITTRNEDQIRVEVCCASDLSSENAPAVRVEVFADSESDDPIASAEGAEAVLTIPDAKLWSDETPNLYRCRVQLLSDGAVIDSAETRFGIRRLEWSGKGLFVNGKETLLRGACIHHDNGILGAAAYPDAEERRIRILKEAGFNAIRSAHNPVSKTMLDACDRLGMYIMDESFDMWMIHKNPYDYAKEDFEQYWKEDTKAMIDKDYSHPSVILYSIGNEISDLGADFGQKICEEMADYVRSLDASRPVTIGANLMLAVMVAKGRGMYGNGKEDEDDSKVNADALTNAPTSEFFNILMNQMGSLMEAASARKGASQVVEKIGGYLDMPGYNYARARYEKEAQLYPDRPFVGSETLPPALFKNWQLVEKIPQLTGDFMWTGWDYLGEAAIGSVRYKNKKHPDDTLPILAGSGVIDILGKKRPEVSWNRMIWGLEKGPVIAVEPYTHADDKRGISMWRTSDAVESWSWDGCEGKKSDILVYADADAVELYVNDKMIGRKKVSEKKALFKGVAYEPGTIRAVSYSGTDGVIAESGLSTAVGPTEIRLNAERTALRANSQDLAFINIDLTDPFGITKSASDQKLRITVEGAGTLQAFGSANPLPKERYYKDIHTTYYGKALAVIRAGQEPGEIRVTVEGAGLKSASVTLTAK